MTAHDGMPALAGLRPVAIEVMRFGFIVFSGAEDGFVIQLLRPTNVCDPLCWLLRYPASNPFCRVAYTG